MPGIIIDGALNDWLALYAATMLECATDVHTMLSHPNTADWTYTE